MGCWSYSAGERPNTVTVFERQPGGILYARAWHDGGWIARSLKHRDKPRARKYARDEAAKLESGEADLTKGKVSLARVFAAYLAHRTPRKTEGEQKEDKRRVEMWTRVLGDIDPHSLTLAQWEGFIDARISGAIDSKGRRVERQRRVVRARTVEYDCDWLSIVFRWASKWRLASGNYLMRENPVRGYEVPTEKNPLRPVATQDRFEAVRAVSDRVLMRDRSNPKQSERSYLSELLDIVNGTGRRISAVCGLRFEDLLLERTKECPYGAIRWPAETDKKGKEWIAPISKTVRAAVERIMRERPGIGNVPLFPSHNAPDRPISRHVADNWMREAEKLAGLPSQRGSLWHAYRRKWATERKHLPDVDVAAAGGWTSLEALKSSYQHADPATMLRVVLEAGELREAK